MSTATHQVERSSRTPCKPTIFAVRVLCDKHQEMDTSLAACKMRVMANALRSCRQRMCSHEASHHTAGLTVQS